MTYLKWLGVPKPTGTLHHTTRVQGKPISLFILISQPPQLGAGCFFIYKKKKKRGQTPDGDTRRQTPMSGINGISREEWKRSTKFLHPRKWRTRAPVLIT